MRYNTPASCLSLSDEEGVAIPANWPNNELVDDKIIIPPAGDEETARETLKRAEAGEMECFDSWFCHKKIEKSEICKFKVKGRLNEGDRKEPS